MRQLPETQGSEELRKFLKSNSEMSSLSPLSFNVFYKYQKLYLDAVISCSISSLQGMLTTEMMESGLGHAMEESEVDVQIRRTKAQPQTNNNRPNWSNGNS